MKFIKRETPPAPDEIRVVRGQQPRYDQFDLWATKDQLKLIETGLQLLMDIQDDKDVDIEGMRYHLKEQEKSIDLWIAHNLCSLARGDCEVEKVRELRQLRAEGELS
jgi:hypothetical protein